MRSDGTDGPVHGHRVDVERERILKAPHRAVRLRPEDAVHLKSFTGVAGLVTELELLLRLADCVAAAAAGQSHVRRVAADREGQQLSMRVACCRVVGIPS